MTFTKADFSFSAMVAAFALTGLWLLLPLLPNHRMLDGELYNLSYEVVSREGETYISPETGKVYRLLWAEKQGEDLHCHVALKEIREYNMELRQSQMFSFEEESMQSLVVGREIKGDGSLRNFDLNFECPDP